MLVVNGFCENGVFVPEIPIANIKGRQKACLNIEETDENNKNAKVKAWKEFSRSIRASDEVLEGEPERIHFRTAEEIASL